MNSLPQWSKYLWNHELINSPSPRFIELDLSNKCNLDCHFCCTREARKKKPVDMKRKTFHKYVELAKEKRIGIDFTGGGEPSMNPNFTQFLGLVLSEVKKENIVGFGLVTNGVSKTAFKGVDAICRHKENNPGSNVWVRVSLNGRKPTSKILELMDRHTGIIGLNLIYSNNGEKARIEHNILENGLRERAKFVNIRRDIYQEFGAFSPLDCVARKFAMIVEPDGSIAYCCQARGMDGRPPDRCPSGCRWHTVNKGLRSIACEVNAWT